MQVILVAAPVLPLLFPIHLMHLCRVLKGEVAAHGWGKSQFIPRPELEYDPTRPDVVYLSHNCLKFRIASCNKKAK